MNLSLKGKKASILGSGGAARSCIFGLSTLGIDDFSIISRNKLTADKVSQDLGNDVTIHAFSSSDASSEKAFKSSDIIVNATPIGRYPSNEFPINISWISNTMNYFRVWQNQFYKTDPFEINWQFVCSNFW